MGARAASRLIVALALLTAGCERQPESPPPATEKPTTPPAPPATPAAKPPAAAAISEGEIKLAAAREKRGRAAEAARAWRLILKTDAERAAPLKDQAEKLFAECLRDGEALLVKREAAWLAVRKKEAQPGLDYEARRQLLEEERSAAQEYAAAFYDLNLARICRGLLEADPAKARERTEQGIAPIREADGPGFPHKELGLPWPSRTGKSMKGVRKSDTVKASSQETGKLLKLCLPSHLREMANVVFWWAEGRPESALRRVGQGMKAVEEGPAKDRIVLAFHLLQAEICLEFAAVKPEEFIRLAGESAAAAKALAEKMPGGAEKTRLTRRVDTLRARWLAAAGRKEEAAALARAIRAATEDLLEFLWAGNILGEKDGGEKLDFLPEPALNLVPDGIIVEFSLFGSADWALKPRRIPSPWQSGPDSVRAIHLGLKWLAANQEADGRWDCGKHGGMKDDYATAAVTGLALLAFLAGGRIEDAGDHAEQVKKALDWLQARQGKDGSFSANNYAHGICALAVAEHFGRSGKRKEMAQAAVDCLCARQKPGGGWDYGDKGDPARDRNDTCITAWAALALKAAKLGGLKFPPEFLAGIRRHLVRAGIKDEFTGQIAYAVEGEKEEAGGNAILALGALTLANLGAAQNDPFLGRAKTMLVRAGAEVANNPYGLFFVTLLMFNSYEEYWEPWFEFCRETLLGNQITNPDAEDGSWDPQGLKYGVEGGRVYSTAFAVLCLEIPYRYLSIYK